MTNQPASGNVEAGGDIQARDIVTGIQQNFFAIFQQEFQPPPDLAQLRADYLAYLRQSYRYLDMKGIMQVQQIIQQLSLTDVYVPLKAHAPQTRLPGRVAGRWWQAEPGELLSVQERTEPVPIEEALKSDPAVVVLGDPGAGKSTLLKVLTLALAQQMDGPLPIILPLNAYARRLQQSEISLSSFLGEYYATRQHKLKQAEALFATALAQQQAVVLLDGLDEVQADRPYLVRLVQDFVAEQMPQPADSPDTVVPGNRIIVTSRIVGYNEAPLAGAQWRVYTLVDFNRDDIEQFVRQWTLAFALGTHGDSEPVRQTAEQERRDLLAAIFGRPSVEQLAANPLLLTILALIKYTGVTLPEQRVKLYELYLEALIESWNLARSLDQKPVGSGLNYEETVQVLAPLALWLRRENPTAGLVTSTQLERWLTAYYHGEEWGLPKGEARQRARSFITSVEEYSNLLLERGEQQYGFLHLTLEEMLAGQGLAQLLDEARPTAMDIFEQYLLEPGWHETLQLTIGFIGVIQRRPKAAGDILTALLEVTPAGEADAGRPVVFAGESLLDIGRASVNRAAAERVIAALVQTMQSPACSIGVRRQAGDMVGRLGWTPTPNPDDLLIAPSSVEPTGLDAFRPVETAEGPVWLGKYLVTNLQFARFVEAGGYDNQELWSDDGWAWRSGRYDSKAPDSLQDWLKNRPPEKRNQPYWWDTPKWNSPLLPVVGVSWFEAEAYGNWLTRQVSGSDQEVISSLAEGKLVVRLPRELEWEAAMGGQGDYPWGDTFDLNHLNCADSWFGRPFKDTDEWRDWLGSDTESWNEAGTTAVTTCPQGVSSGGQWDGSGNVWEWLLDFYDESRGTRVLRGGAWIDNGRDARVSYRNLFHPDDFNLNVGFRLVVAPVFP